MYVYNSKCCSKCILSLLLWPRNPKEMNQGSYSLTKSTCSISFVNKQFPTPNQICKTDVTSLQYTYLSEFPKPCGYTSLKEAAFVLHKWPFKSLCSHMEKAHTPLCLTATPKVLGKHSSNVCVPIMDSFSSLLLCYTFSITSCCFPCTQPWKKKKREKVSVDP